MDIYGLRNTNLTTLLSVANIFGFPQRWKLLEVVSANNILMELNQPNHDDETTPISLKVYDNVISNDAIDKWVRGSEGVDQ